MLYNIVDNLGHYYNIIWKQVVLNA